MTLLDKLDELAEAIRARDLIAEYDVQFSNVENLRLRLNWDWGASCPGYEATARAITALVKPKLDGLYDEALALAQAKVTTLGAEVAKLLAEEVQNG